MNLVCIIAFLFLGFHPLQSASSRYVPNELIIGLDLPIESSQHSEFSKNSVNRVDFNSDQPKGMVSTYVQLKSVDELESLLNLLPSTDKLSIRSKSSSLKFWNRIDQLNLNSGNKNGRNLSSDETNIPSQLVVKFSDTTPILDLISKFERTSGIKFVQPNFIYSIWPEGVKDTVLDKINEHDGNEPTFQVNHSGTIYGPNSFQFASLSDAVNDPFVDRLWNLEIMSSEEVWDLTIGSSSTVIAVVDTGVDLGHPDLNDNIWTNENEIPNNGVDDDNNGFVDDVFGWDFISSTQSNNPSDQNGHGTHVAGDASAVANNAVGIASIGYSCKIMAIRAGDEDGNFTSASISDSVDYAVANGADVINLSIGGQSEASEIVLQTSIANAIAAGIPVVAAAGNADPRRNIDTNNIIPASYPNVITVGALTEELDKSVSYAFYSNYGPSLDIMAAGTNVYSTYYSTLFKSIYVYDSGTSMASPQVAGVVGLMKSVYPQLTTEQVTNALTSTARDLGVSGRDDDYGYGLVQSASALLSLDSKKATATYLQSLTVDVSASFTVSINVTDDLFSTVVPTVNIVYQFEPNSDSSSWMTKGMNRSGDQFFTSLDSASSPGTFNYYFEVNDLNRSNDFEYPEEGATNPLSAIVKDISPPIISSAYINNDYFAKNGIFKETITDNTSVDSSSISLAILADGFSESFDVSDEGVTFEDSVFSVDLSTVDFSSSSSFTFLTSVSDINGLSSSSEVVLKTEETSGFNIFGPNDESEPIVNSPNPFNPENEVTNISFQLNQNADILINIYSISYEKVFDYSSYHFAGYHQVEWDGRNTNGSRLPMGAYLIFLRGESNGEVIVRKTKAMIIY